MSFAIEVSSEWESYWRFEGKNFTVIRFGWVSVCFFDKELSLVLWQLTKENACLKELNFDFEDELHG